MIELAPAFSGVAAAMAQAVVRRNNSISIRNATEADREVIIGLIHKMFLETEKDGFPSTILPTIGNATLLYDRMIAQAVAHGDPVLIAETPGQVVGFIAGCIRRDGFDLAEPAAFGSGLYIHPEFRGVGLTKLLLHEVERQLRAAGIKVWEEAVFCGNLFPQAVLNSLGFTHSMRVYRKAL